MKLALKLLILVTLVASVAALCGGWKWAAKPKATKALAYAFASAPVDANAPISSTSPGTAVTTDGWTWDTGE
jgi:hypothetical protein